MTAHWKISNSDQYFATKASNDLKRFNTTLRPETIAWLKRGGNASQRIEDLVDAARSGYLQGFQVDKTDANDELEKLKTK
jgi:hypothetical protein